MRKRKKKTRKKKKKKKKEEEKKKEDEKKKLEEEMRKAEEKKKEEELKAKRIRPIPADGYQNWSDFFFIMDVLSGTVDASEILLFISKTDDLIPLVEQEKKVDVHSSRLDVTHGTLSLTFTHGGIIEDLLDLELSTAGGLKVCGWLEGPTGRLETASHKVDQITGKKMITFDISMGTSYELISALYARGRQLARLTNYSINLPQDLKARHKKKYGLTNVPLAAITQAEGRPLSLNFDIGR